MNFEQMLTKTFSIRPRIGGTRGCLLARGIRRNQTNNDKKEVLLDDIARNRRWMQAILKRLTDVQGAEGLSLNFKELAREELLPEGQHLKLAKALLEEELDSRG